MKAHAFGPSLSFSSTAGPAVLKFLVMVLVGVVLAGVVLIGGAPPAWAGPPPTITSLAVTASGIPVTTVAQKAVVTLTATVTAGGAAITVGQVNFCDAERCTDIHLLGTQQVTGTGVAVMNFTPGPGSHKYKAVFVGNINHATSSSAYTGLTVTGIQYPTSTTITQSGTPLSYELLATVTGTGAGATAAPSGTVSFQDASNGNAPLGSGVLYPGPTQVSWPESGGGSTNGNPYPMAVADFNGDGNLDVAVGNNGDGDPGFVTIFLGNGDGTFNTVQTKSAISDVSEAVAVGDFNGDGIPDLAVAAFDGTLNILLGQGDGTFYPPPHQTERPAAPGVYYPYSIAVGDFNRDGIADLAVTNLSGGTVTVLLGQGDGTFKPAAVNPAGGFDPASIAVGDFNGDGIPDLAVSSTGAGIVTILLGNGNGSFTPAAVSPAVSGASMVVSGDFNRDGKADLALLTGSTVTVLLGNGDSTFSPPPNQSQPPIATPVAMRSYAMALGDFNGDGIPDLIVLNGYDYLGPLGDPLDFQFYFGAVVALLGAGDGGFAATSTTLGDNMVMSDQLPAFIVAADFTGSGVSSLVADATYGPCGCGEQDVFASITRANPTATAAVTGVTLPEYSGIHQVEASYPGDTNYTPSLSGSIPLAAPTQVILTPASLSFSSLVGYSTESQNITLINHGSTPLAIQSIQLTGAGASSYATSNDCPTSLPAGAGCRIGVRFIPAGYGEPPAAITVTDNAQTSPQSVALSGESGSAYEPDLVLSATNLAFGSVPVGYSSNTLSATLTATGDFVALSSITLGGPSASSYVTSNTCDLALAAGSTCQIGVRFVPQTVGAAFPATITLVSNSVNSPETLTLSGSSFTSAPTTLSFSSSSATLPFLDFLTYREVYVTNTGDAPAYFASIALGGANPASYVTSNTCGAMLAVGATCHIGVRLNPAMPGQAPLPADITLIDNAAGSPQVITLNESTGP